MNPSGERVTVNELVNVLVISDEPLKFVLINTVSERITKTFDQCIETGLCSFGLMPTVKNTKEVITNLCNFVTVEIHGRLISFGIESNSRVCRCPILIVSNCVVHLLFDLTH